MRKGISAKGVDIDVGHWPTAVFRHTPELTTDGLTEALDWWDAHIPAEGPYAVIIDARGCERMTAVHRKLIIDRMQTNPEHLQNCAAAGFVFESTFLRGILNAILWVAKPPYPIRTFRDFDPAVTWTQGLVVERSSPSPQAQSQT